MTFLEWIFMTWPTSQEPQCMNNFLYCCHFHDKSSTVEMAALWRNSETLTIDLNLLHIVQFLIWKVLPQFMSTIKRRQLRRIIIIAVTKTLTAAALSTIIMVVEVVKRNRKHKRSSTFVLPKATSSLKRCSWLVNWRKVDFEFTFLPSSWTSSYKFIGNLAQCVDHVITSE